MRAFHHNFRARSYGKIVFSTPYFGLWQNPFSYQGKKGRISLFPCYMYRGDWRGKERPFHRYLIRRGNWLWAPPNAYYNISVFSFYIPDSCLPPPQLAGNVFSAFSIIEASGISFFSLPHSQSHIYLPLQCLPVSSHDNLHVSGSFSVPLSGPSTHVLVQKCGPVHLHCIPDRLLGLLNTVLITWVTGHLGLQISWKLTFWELTPIPALAIFKRSYILSIHSLWQASTIFLTFGAKPSSY